MLERIEVEINFLERIPSDQLKARRWPEFFRLRFNVENVPDTFYGRASAFFKKIAIETAVLFFEEGRDFESYEGAVEKTIRDIFSDFEKWREEQKNE